MRSALYLTNTLGRGFVYSANSLKQKSALDMSPHYPDSKPNSLFFPFKMLRRRSSKYQFYTSSLWFDPIGARTDDLPHSRRAR